MLEKYGVDYAREIMKKNLSKASFTIKLIFSKRKRVFKCDFIQEYIDTSFRFIFDVFGRYELISL